MDRMWLHESVMPLLDPKTLGAMAGVSKIAAAVGKPLLLVLQLQDHKKKCAELKEIKRALYMTQRSKQNAVTELNDRIHSLENRDREILVLKGQLEELGVVPRKPTPRISYYIRTLEQISNRTKRGWLSMGYKTKSQPWSPQVIGC